MFNKQMTSEGVDIAASNTVVSVIEQNVEGNIFIENALWKSLEA